MSFSLRALGGVGAVLLLTACGTVPPQASPTAPSVTTPTESPSSESPSTSPSASASSASPSPSLTITPTVDAIVLQPTGIRGAAFGTPEKEVVDLLTAKAGKADESGSGPVCELNDATPYGRQLLYGGVVYLFQSKAKGTKNSPRTFTSWLLNLEQPLKPAMKLAEGYPVDTTFAKLKSAFPAGKLTKVSLGESAVYVFRTPAGIWYRGDDNKTPTDMGAGPMGTCE